MAGDIAKLLASLDLDTRPFSRGAGRVSGDLSKMEGGFSRISTRAIALGSAVGVGIERLAEKGISVLFDSIHRGEEELRTLQDAQAQTAGVIESTGGKAGVTADQVRQLAESIEDLTTADDKAVQQGENLLLTFTNIGGEVFPQATKAIVDLGIALNKGNAETADFDGTAIQLGKALSNPIKGLTALRRIGVVFSADQERLIRGFIKQGDVVSAQKVILGEIEKEFGKAGEAAGTSGAAGIRRLNDAVEDSQRALAEGLAPALEEIRGEITKGLRDPGTQIAIRNLGVFLGDAAKSGLAFAKSVPWGQVADGLKTAAGFAGKLFDTFAHLPPGVQATIIGLAGLNKLAGGGVIRVGVDLFKEGAKGLLGQFISRGSPANPMFVVAEGGLGGAGGLPGATGGTTGVLATGAKLIPVVAVGALVGEAVAEFNRANGITPRNLREEMFHATVAALNGSKTLVAIATNTSGSPDDRDEQRRADQQKAKLDTAKAAIDRSRDSIETARIAQVSATKSGSSGIIDAIERNQPKVTVNVTVKDGQVSTSYETGGNIGGGGGRRAKG